MSDLPLLACLPTEIFSAPATGSGWIISPKIDGHRIIIDYRGSTPRILNRNGRPYSAGPFRLDVPEVMRGFVLDGEYVPDKRTYVAFDCLSHPEYDRGALNYERTQYDRSLMIADIFMGAEMRHSTSWQMVACHKYITTTWIDFYRSFHDGHGGLPREEGVIPIDGVVFKRASATYQPGRGTTDWLKLKFTASIDCFVTALNIDDKSNCELALHDPLSDRTFPVGKASTNGKVGVKVGTVVTVRFLKFTKGGRLREPRIVDVRDDKAPSSCTIDQLIPFAAPMLGE